MMLLSLRELPRVYSLGQIRQPAGWTNRSHISHQMMVFVQSGDMTFVWKNFRAALHEGEYLLLPIGVRYEVSSTDGCQYHFVHFDLAKPAQLLNAAQAQAVLEERLADFEQARSPSTFALPVDSHERMVIPIRGSLGQMQEKIILLLTECDMHRYSLTPIRKTTLDLRFAEILNLLDQGAQLTHRKPAPPVLVKMQLFIHQHYTECVTLAQLSDAFSLSKQYIMALFKEHTGISVTRYVNQLKLEHALDLLRYSSFRIGEIAEMLGFSSAYYFCRLFRRQFGMTPSEYIRLHREG